MNEKVVLLCDHTWYAVYDKEQAQKIINEHEWKYPTAYGIYIEPQQQILLFKEEKNNGQTI